MTPCGTENLEQLIPAPPPRATLPSPAAPKRDHDEWLVWWGLGGGRVAGLQAQSTTVGAGSPAEPLTTHGALDVGRFRGRGCAHTRPGEVVTRVDSRSQAAHAPRDAARDAPAPWCHKPKTPIGRRGESLKIVADYPRRGNRLAGPASLPHQPEAETPAGASSRPSPRRAPAAERLAPTRLAA